MARKKRVFKRQAGSSYVEPFYEDSLFSLLMKRVMKNGEKEKAEGICYESFRMLKEKTGENPLHVFHMAVQNVKPSIELRSLRVGKSNFQVPFPLHQKRRIFFAMKWLVQFANTKKGPIVKNLFQEIFHASQNRGASIEQKQKLHKMAEANRASLRYRW